MMKLFYKVVIRTFYVLFLLVAYNGSVCAQTDTSKTISPTHTIGVQFNPYINSDLFEGASNSQRVYALRYAYALQNGVMFGPEVSGFDVNHWRYTNWQINIGAFVRYAHWRQSALSPFAEISVYYAHGRWKDKLVAEHIQMAPLDIKINKLSVYFAPGCSINVYKHRLKLDLMIKFNTSPLIDGKKILPTYRITYSF